MSERSSRLLLAIAGAYLAFEGLFGLWKPESLGALYGIERVASTTSMRMLAGNGLIMGALLWLVSRRPHGQGLFVSFVCILCAISALIWFHSAATVVGVPAEQMRGELYQGVALVAVAVMLAIARIGGATTLGPLWAKSRAPLPGSKVGAWIQRVVLVLFGLMFVMQGLKGVMSPADSALGSGVAYGMLWSVTLTRLINFSLLAFGLGLLYSAWNLRDSGLFVLAFALMLTKSAMVLAFGASVIAMPVQVYEASSRAAVALAIMASIAWIVRLAARRTLGPLSGVRTA